MVRVAVCGALVFSASADPIQPHQVAVIDGDTIRIDQTKPDIRLVGFNAPETSGAKCPAEREFQFMAINVGRLVGQNPIILIHKFYQ